MVCCLNYSLHKSILVGIICPLTDLLEFVVIKHSGFRSDGTTVSTDNLFINKWNLDHYYDKVIPNIISKIDSIPDGTIIDPKMKEILNGTLTRPEQRINFDRKQHWPNRRKHSCK